MSSEINQSRGKQKSDCGILRDPGRFIAKTEKTVDERVEVVVPKLGHGEVLRSQPLVLVLVQNHAQRLGSQDLPMSELWDDDFDPFINWLFVLIWPMTVGVALVIAYEDQPAGWITRSWAWVVTGIPRLAKNTLIGLFRVIEAVVLHAPKEE